MLAVTELPQVDAGRVQAKTMTRIGVKRNGSVVKLLPEDNPGVAHGLDTIGIILLPMGAWCRLLGYIADSLWKRFRLNVRARMVLAPRRAELNTNKKARPRRGGDGAVLVRNVDWI